MCKERTPIQLVRSQAIGWVEIYPEYADGLKDIKELYHIHLLYLFHQSSRYKLQIKLFLDDREHGIFATRYPYLSNLIDLSTVRLLFRQENRLIIAGSDVLDLTPLLDIKTYVPNCDTRTEDVGVGCYETRSKEQDHTTFHQRHWWLLIDYLREELSKYDDLERARRP